MGCLNEDTLLEFLQHQLPSQERAEVERHLDTCAECRRWLAEVAADGPLPPAAPEQSSPKGPEDQTALAPGSSVGHFIVLEQVGVGAMGRVYAAHDPQLHRKVALKLLREEGTASLPQQAQARLLREAQALARLSHPHVISVYEVGTVSTGIFIAMEFVEGGTLTHWLRARRRAWREVVATFLGAAEGLAAAHTAGLVHRDFKPDNVLIGTDGRVRVTDFGLAGPVRAGEQPMPEEPAPGEPAPALAPLTRTGALLGTPAYMSPEQLEGGSASPRSDQFSFCVALYEALHGERPFTGRNLAELRQSIARGLGREPPGARRLPSGLRRALRRGLSPSPEERWGSMEELARALRQALEPGWRRWGLAAAAAAAAGMLLLVLQGQQAHQAALCAGGEEQLAGRWNASRKQAIRQAFLATGLPYAEEAWTRTESLLDAHATQWVAMRREACEATRIRGEQSDQLLGLRMVCLDRSLTQLTALGDVLERADRQVVERAVEAAGKLGRLSHCADAAALLAGAPEPEEPAQRARVEQLRRTLAEASARLHAGKYPDALERAQGVVAAAREVAHAPTEAEALSLVGQLQEKSGDYAASEQALYESIWAAERGRDDRLRTDAWVQLIIVVGERRARPEEGAQCGKHAAAALQRVRGDTRELEGRLLRNLAALLMRKGEPKKALEHLDRALSLLQAALGAESSAVAAALQLRAGTLELDGDYARSLEDGLRTLAIYERVLGPRHPDIISSLNNLGRTFRLHGQFEQAQAYYTRALTLAEEVLGPEHPKLANLFTGMGVLMDDLGRLDEARSHHQRALAIREKALGPGHFLTGVSVINLGELAYQQGRYAEALENYRRVFTLWSKQFPADHYYFAYYHVDMGDVLRAQGKYLEALAHYQRVPSLKGVEHTQLAEALIGEAQAHLALREPRRAIPALERALELLGERSLTPYLLARARFALAQGLWARGEARGRALELATQAREAYAGGGPGHQGHLAEVEAWLKSRAAPVAPGDATNSGCLSPGECHQEASP